LRQRHGAYIERIRPGVWGGAANGGYTGQSPRVGLNRSEVSVAPLVVLNRLTHPLHGRLDLGL
jgi:hypothetical protein